MYQQAKQSGDRQGHDWSMRATPRQVLAKIQKVPLGSQESWVGIRGAVMVGGGARVWRQGISGEVYGPRFRVQE